MLKMGRTYRTVEGFDAKKQQRELKKSQKRSKKLQKKQARKGNPLPESNNEVHFPI